MLKSSRRNFLTQMSGFALLPLAFEKPEFILYNGNFITIDPAQPRAEAVAIAGGRLLAVGSNSQIRALSTSSTRSENLGGKTVVPGFIDAHSHVASSGRRHIKNIDCDLRTIPEIQKAIRDRAAITPPGEWVLGFKYDDTKNYRR